MRLVPGVVVTAHDQRQTAPGRWRGWGARVVTADPREVADSRAQAADSRKVAKPVSARESLEHEHEHGPPREHDAAQKRTLPQRRANLAKASCWPVVRRRVRPCSVDEDQASPCRSPARGLGPASDHSTTWLRSIPAVPLLLDDEPCGSRFPVAAYGVTPLLARPTVAHSPGSQVEARVCMCMCSGTARLCTCGLFEPCTPSRAV